MKDLAPIASMESFPARDLKSLPDSFHGYDHSPNDSASYESLRMARQSDGSGDEKDDIEGDIALKTREKTKKPSMYKVLLLNDDYTPMEFVVVVLERFFRMPRQQAVLIMIMIHQKGSAVAGVFPLDIAETKATQVMNYARKNKHPLQCRLEKE